MSATMEPRIQYAKTSDGVSIAYYAMGEGKPLLVMPPLICSHLTLEWEFGPLRDWYLHVDRSRTLVRLDPRCHGLSDRGVRDISQTAWVSDIQAVVRRLGLRELDIIAISGWNLSVIEFAARHPGLVSRLVLINPMVRRNAWMKTPVGSLLEQDYELFCETFAHFLLGWEAGTRAHDYARFLRTAITKEDLARELASIPTHSAEPYLDQVDASTLVIQSGEPRVVSDARDIASRIPKAEVVELRLEGGFFETKAAADAIDDFLGIERGPEALPATTDTSVAAGTAVILFADIAESTALTERLGDAAFRAKARDLDGALRAVIREHNGTAIEGKLLGDGVLAVFTSARQAIEAALACGKAGDESGLPLHLGLHAGDVIREDDNVYGGAVNIAARVSGLSVAGEVLVSETVRSLARTSAGVSFEDRGEQALKGVGEPVRIWAVGVGE
jgi:class 3 adenylate cyclase/pimeloyl-ACP methyl ester carboxylesterase